jgi:hypothetical protein
MKNATDKLYEHLEGPERLTLVLEALARGDEAEADRLSGSCPRKRYTMRDAEYGDRLDTALHLMAIACIDLRCLWDKLDSLEWAIGAARQMATHHQIAATFAFMEGEGFAKGLPQMDFFGRKASREDEEDQEDDGPASGSDDDAADIAEQEPELTTPKPLRASDYRRGELARRMMAVEDRMQVKTDDTFAALL